MVAVAALSVLARAVNVPYPILLVIGGIVLGAIPGLPDIALDPDLVLALFLPPLLYGAAFFSSLRDLRRDLRPISLLAVGLVLITTCAVAVTAHALIGGLNWAAAFALGAIVSPTDALAATTIARRLGAPRRLVNVVEGEALLNDGVALFAYRFAVAAAVGGGFSLWEAGWRFVVGAAGGILVGLAVGWLITEVRRRIEDAQVEITISLITGYAAFLPAEALGLSGVLAAVAAGIYLGWMAPHIASPATRIEVRPVWNNLTFLLNAVLFILVGLQLPVVLDGLSGHSTSGLIGQAAVVCAAVVGLRIAWGFTVPYLLRAIDRRPSVVARRASGRERFLVAWSGMRGAVTLAAALALPLRTDAGAPFPERDLIIFLAFTVVLFTLVFQGLTLPLLMRRLEVHDDGAEEHEELEARLAAADAALMRLDEVSTEGWAREDTVERLRGLYNYRRRRFSARAGEVEDDGYEDRSIAYQRLLRELLSAQRQAVIGLRNRGAISQDVMHRIERELDLEDNRLEI
jgi:monovalent cation/hydrogen antiporter